MESIAGKNDWNDNKKPKWVTQLPVQHLSATMKHVCKLEIDRIRTMLAIGDLKSEQRFWI